MIPIKVLLAEDHTIVRKGLYSLLNGDAEIEIIGEAENGREAVAKTEELQPDVVVMDIAMPLLNGLEATRQIKNRCPEVKVLVLTMHANEEYVLQVFKAGASGYLIKNAAPSELITAIRTLFRGEAFISPGVSKRIIEEYVKLAQGQSGIDSYDKLTSREREVLQMLAEGHTNREIAESLQLSVKTVESHRASLMEKLDLHGTAELTQYAIRKGIIHID